MDLHPRKRKTSEKACFLCQKDMVECDERTPCSRCIIKGVPHMCFSSTRASPNYPFNNSIRPNISPTTPKAATTANTNTTPTNSNTANSSQSNKNVNNSNNSNNSNSNSNSNNSNNNSNNSQQSKSSNKDNNDNQPTDIVKQDYNGIANLLINELRELKDGQKKIYDELIYLRAKNDKLELVNESLLSKLSSLTTNDTQPHQLLQSNNIHTDNALSYPRTIHEVPDYFHNIFIVIDLLKYPPIVLNCSKSFSQLIGYSQDEIIGLPWTEITHPNLMEKTMSFFQQHHRNLSDKKTMEVAQVYKCKDGSIFSTIDTHTLVYDSENTKPICDLVNIRLLEGTETIGYTSSDIIKSASVANSNRLRLKNEISSVDESPPSTPVNYNQSTTATTTTTTPTPTAPTTPTKNYNNNNNSYNSFNNNTFTNSSKIYEQPSTPSTPITPGQLNSTIGNATPITPITTTSNDFNSKMVINDIPSVIYNVNSNEMDLNNDANNQFLIPNAFTYDPLYTNTDLPNIPTSIQTTLNNNNNINNTIIQPPLNTHISATTPMANSNTNLISSNNGLLTEFLDPMLDATSSNNHQSNSMWNFDTDWSNIPNPEDNSKQL